MSAFGKIFGIVFLPFGIIMILDAQELFSLPFSTVILVGAILMIAFQALNLFWAKQHNDRLGTFQVVTALVFILPAAYYLLRAWLPAIPHLSLIIGVMMLMEGLYALH